MQSPKRNPLQFNLRKLFAFIVVCLLISGYIGYQRRQSHRQELALDALLSRGGRITYSNNRSPRRAAIVAAVLGRDRTGDHAHLFLDGPAVTDKDLVHLQGFPKLRLLTLGPGVTDKGMVHVARLQRLEWLNLSQTQVTPEGLKTISSMTRLENLCLNGRRFDDDSLRPVASMNLKSLNLGASSVSDRGLAHLSHMPALESLWLGATNVSDTGLAHLTTIRTLKHVNVMSTPNVTQNGELTLRKAFGADFWIEDPQRNPQWD